MSQDIFCPVEGICGGCQLLDIPYQQQLAIKQRYVKKLLGEFCNVEPIIGMEYPFQYRNKIEFAFGINKSGNIVYGKYQSLSHSIVQVSNCLLEDTIADKIVQDVAEMLPHFGITPYDERRERGILRHILVRRAFSTDETMLVLVSAVPMFKTQKKFVLSLIERHPEITTIVLNVNNKHTSMVLGKEETVLYGKGFIEDILCGYRFRISAQSFYQVNPIQTEILYKTAIDYAHLTGKESVLDAYCGTGTIGIVASKSARMVLGVELNPDAVRDAITNAKRNSVRNCRFICGDAGRFMSASAHDGQTPDVLFMDPPRSGSDYTFLKSAIMARPHRIVYISCNPDTLARDLNVLVHGGYSVRKIQPVDMFPHTEHIENVCLLCKK